MRMLKITAGNVHDALAEARRLLGEEAAILHTKQYEEPLWMGLRKRRGVEILAAAPMVKSAPTPKQTVTASQYSKPTAQATVAKDPSPKRSPWVERLIDNGVSENLAEAVLGRIGESKDEILSGISGRIRCTGPINCDNRQVRVALVGPTGVGKTTTAAKLAAQYSLFHNKSVALITLDTYRIGAVEQLATYARILNIQLEVAFSPEDGDAIIEKHSDKDLIIIDTVGRSQRNKEHLAELGSFLKSAKPTDVFLVVSASADIYSSREAVNSFGILGADRLLMTKLDECTRPGCVLEMAASSLMPYTYITFGQDVPEDIAVAEKESLAEFVLEGKL